MDLPLRAIEQGPARPFRLVLKFAQFHFQWFQHLEGCSRPHPQWLLPGSPGLGKVPHS